MNQLNTDLARGFWRRPAEHLGVKIRRVVYDPAELERFVLSGLSMLQEQFGETPADRGSLIELARSFVADLFAFKAPQWSAEREIRISRLIIRDHPGTPGGLVDVGGYTSDFSPVGACAVEVRSTASGPAAYIELPFDGPEKGALREITLGSRCTPSQKAEFKRLDAVREGRVRLNLW